MKLSNRYTNLVANIIEEMMFNRLFEEPNEVDQYLLNRGLSPYFEHYQFTGTFRKTKFDDAIVIPLRDPDKNLFGAWIRQTKEKDFRIFLFKSKNDELQPYQKYWLCDDFDETKPTIIFESIFDALSYRQLTGDKRNVASSLGISPTPGLISICKSGIIYCYDNDLAGLRGMLNKRSYDGVILFDSTKDVNELLLKHLEGKQFKFEEYSGLEATVQVRRKLSEL